MNIAPFVECSSSLKAHGFEDVPQPRVEILIMGAGRLGMSHDVSCIRGAYTFFAVVERSQSSK